MCVSLYEQARKKNNHTFINDEPFYQLMISDKESILLKESGQQTSLYYSVKFLKGIFVDGVCQKGNVYMEFIIDESANIWGLHVRRKGKNMQYGIDDDNSKLLGNDIERMQAIHESLIRTVRDVRINNIIE